MLKRKYYALAACLLMCMLYVSEARADLSFAVVDVQRIMTESNAAKSIQKQVQEKREVLQSEFAGYEQTLRDNEKELIEKRGDMSAEEFKSKRESFQKDLQETGTVVQGKKRDLERSLVTATAKLRGEILRTVAKIAEEKNYDVVMTRQNIVLVAKTLDITEEVMQAINAKINEIPLTAE